MTEPKATSHRKRRWLRFHLRTLLVLVTVLCVWLAFRTSVAMRQRDVVDRLGKSFEQHTSHPSLRVEYDYEWDADFKPTGADRPPGPAWLQDLLGVDYFQTVIALHLHGATDRELIDLQELPHLQRLVLGGQFSDAELYRLASHQKLTLLDVDLSYAPRVTDRGLAFLGKLTNLTLLRLSVSDAVTADGLEPLRQLINLEELDITFDGAQGERVLAHISKLPRLRKLQISIQRGEQQLNAGLAHLAAARNLQELHIGFLHPGVPNAQVAPSNLGTISTLKRLSLGSWTGQSLDYLATLGELEELSLSGARDLSAVGLAGLQSMPRLRSLNLWLCDTVTLQGVKGSTSLQELRVDGCPSIASRGLSDLEGLPNLRLLSLVHCDGISLAGVNACPTLEDLTVDQCSTTGDDLPHLAGAPNLRKLALNGTGNLSLKKFPTIPNLCKLDIQRCSGLQDSDIASLVAGLNSSRSLRRLRMDLNDSMTDAALASISQLGTLEDLELFLSPAMTDQGASQLAQLVNLKRLEVSNSYSKVTAKSMEQLRKALPNCRIGYDP